MSEEQKEKYYYDPVKAANEFALGKITLTKFEKSHPTGKAIKWDHMEYVKKQPFIWHQLIEKLPVPYRIKACLDSENLSVNNLSKNMQITAGDYVNRKKFELMNEGIQTTLLKLAVVLDIPLRYLRGFDTDSLVIEDFEEYDHLMVNNKTTLSNAISWTLEKEVYRKIQGFIIDNSNQEISFIHKNNAYVRVDKNVNYFRFEIFLESRPYATFKQIETLLLSFQNTVHYIFKEDSILRKTPKLTLIGAYENSDLELLKEYAIDLYRQPRKEKIYPI